MSQQVSNPPEEQAAPEVTTRTQQPLRKPLKHLPGAGIPAMFILIGLSLLLFTVQIIQGLLPTVPASAHVQATPTKQPTTATTPTARATPTATPTPQQAPALPFFPLGNPAAPTLQLSTGRYVIYQSSTHISLISTTDMHGYPLYTPGYAYSSGVRPIVTPNNQIIYTGPQGIWLTDPFEQQPTQLFQIDATVQVTSLILSQDGKTIAWTTEPINGNGQISFYAGPLVAPQLVLQTSLQNCPCYHFFDFLNGSDTNVLLTDDRNSNGSTQYGLWSLDLSKPTDTPRQIMDENSLQGPLLLAPYSNVLLYSANEQAVPAPTDGSVPADVASQAYANSLSITTINPSTPLDPASSQVILDPQKELANSAQYRWVTTPAFSPDGKTLAYVEFSSDAQDPYDRHSSLFIVHVSGSGASLQVDKPQLVAISTVRFLEIGPWLNSHVVSMYGDGILYALDIQSGSIATLGTPGGYLRILGIIGSGQN